VIGSGRERRVANLDRPGARLTSFMSAMCSSMSSPKVDSAASRGFRGALPRSICSSASAAHLFACAWRWKVSLNTWPLRRTCARQRPDFCFLIEAMVFRCETGAVSLETLAKNVEDRRSLPGSHEHLAH
jgi:hypothetical protein